MNRLYRLLTLFVKTTFYIKYYCTIALPHKTDKTKMYLSSENKITLTINFPESVLVCGFNVELKLNKLSWIVILYLNPSLPQKDDLLRFRRRDSQAENVHYFKEIVRCKHCKMIIFNIFLCFGSSVKVWLHTS